MEDVAAQMLALELGLLHDDHRANPDRLQGLIAEEFEEIAASGHRADRAEVVRWLLDKDATWRWELSDLRVREASESLRLVQYHARQVQPPRPDSRGASHVSLWRHEAGRWRLWFHQATRVP